MRKILLLLMSLPLITFADPTSDKRLVSELSIDELKQIVRSIVEESIEQCVVTGTMEGRAKVNLKVEGEVVAKMECEFKQPNKIEEVNGRKILNALNQNNKKVIISIKCETKDLDVRIPGRKWRGWNPAKEEFEKNLINDFC